MPASCRDDRAPPQLPVIVSWSNHRWPSVVCWAIAGHEKNAAAANKTSRVCWNHCFRFAINGSINSVPTASASGRKALYRWALSQIPTPQHVSLGPELSVIGGNHNICMGRCVPPEVNLEPDCSSDVEMRFVVSTNRLPMRSLFKVEHPGNSTAGVAFRGVTLPVSRDADNPIEKRSVESQTAVAIALVGDGVVSPGIGHEETGLRPSDSKLLCQRPAIVGMVLSALSFFPQSLVFVIWPSPWCWSTETTGAPNRWNYKLLVVQGNREGRF